MYLTFKASLSEENKLQLPHPADFTATGHYEERKTELIETWGNFHANELWFEGVCLIQSETILKKSVKVNISCNDFCWIMNFVLPGGSNVYQSANGKSIILNEGTYITFYTPVLNLDLVLKMPAKMFTICLTHKYISKLMGNDAINPSLEKDPVLINAGNYNHTRLQAIVKEIMEATQPGFIRRIFLESKILELLSIQLQSAEHKEQTKGFSKDDVARLQQAKQIIAQNLQKPYSLIELARKAGLNDFKLKKGFKALFGYTVFGYLFELRMDNAQKFLRDGKSVSEVAEYTGYKNPHHFTTAFKRKFGILPSQVAKMFG